jgi:hypothetical protein
MQAEKNKTKEESFDCGCGVGLGFYAMTTSCGQKPILQKSKGDSRAVAGPNTAKPQL